jgi:Pentapeptide repeats (8 copies)
MSLPPHKENLPPFDGEKTQKAIEDWNRGKELLAKQRKKPQTLRRRASTAIKQAFIRIEKRNIEPFANLLDRVDIFRVVEKLSPVLEAAGVIMIPIVIWWMTDSGQKAKEEADKAARAQEAVKTYLNQLSTVFLDGNLEKDERLRTVTRASTLALLNDPNLDGERKGQVIKYLTELKLVQMEAKDPKNLTEEEKSKKPLISLASSNLEDAYLVDADLTKANLSRANLSGVNLHGADLRGAYLSRVNLNRAHLFGVDLSGADLGEANLVGVDLRETNLAEVDLSRAYLCKTKLPPSIKLDSNRDCIGLGITP